MSVTVTDDRSVLLPAPSVLLAARLLPAGRDAGVELRRDGVVATAGLVGVAARDAVGAAAAAAAEEGAEEGAGAAAGAGAGAEEGAEAEEGAGSTDPVAGSDTAGAGHAKAASCPAVLPAFAVGALLLAQPPSSSRSASSSDRTAVELVVDPSTGVAMMDVGAGPHDMPAAQSSPSLRAGTDDGAGSELGASESAHWAQSSDVCGSAMAGDRSRSPNSSLGRAGIGGGRSACGIAAEVSASAGGTAAEAGAPAGGTAAEEGASTGGCAGGATDAAGADTATAGAANALRRAISAVLALCCVANARAWSVRAASAARSDATVCRCASWAWLSSACSAARARRCSPPAVAS